MSCCGQSFGEINIHSAIVEGPFDWNCSERYSTQKEYDDCIHGQENQNLAIGLDSPELWTHRLLPMAAIGVSLGVLTGYLVWGRK